MPSQRVPAGAAVWVLHMALPVLGLWLLVARPAADVMWENPTAHFWLVLTVAMINIVIATVMNLEAGRRGDSRLFLVSLGFATSAGFLALHALATPGLLFDKNTGFIVATPVGLLITSLFAAWSALSFTPAGNARLLAARPLLRGFVIAALVIWLVASLMKVPPLARPTTAMEVHGRLLAMTAVGALGYGYAAVRYWLIYRARPSVMLISVITAWVLLAEAMLSVSFGRNWHASWWEWHVLMALGFGFVAYSAVVQWGKEGSGASLFAGIGLEPTLRAAQQEYGAALEALVDVVNEQTEGRLAVAAARVADRFDLTERQRDLLVQAAEALAHERDQIARLGTLVDLGREASVMRTEDEFLADVTTMTASGFGTDLVQVRLIRGGTLSAPTAEGPNALSLPITVKGKAAGVLDVHRAQPFAERDRALYESFASQLSIALENTRLYRQMDTLFRSYISPDVATSLLADPDQAALGGAVAEVTVLMADLHDFTPFAEQTAPADVVGMLNTYYGVIVPVILDEGGTVVQFVGDAIMAIFNAPVPQSDHALRAARAGLRLQQVTAAAAGEHSDWPRFRVGINSGSALVGNIGAETMRNFTAIGDTTNLAARLQTSAGVGEVVISGSTLALLGPAAVAEALGELELKGKSLAVTAYRLIGLA